MALAPKPIGDGATDLIDSRNCPTADSVWCSMTLSESGVVTSSVAAAWELGQECDIRRAHRLLLDRKVNPQAIRLELTTVIIPNRIEFRADCQTDSAIPGVQDRAQDVVDEWPVNGDQHFHAGIRHFRLFARELRIRRLAYARAQTSGENDGPVNLAHFDAPVVLAFFVAAEGCQRTKPSMPAYSAIPSLSYRPAVCWLRASERCQNSRSSGPGYIARSFWL